MAIETGQNYVREGSYAERNLDPAVRTMSTSQMVGQVCRTLSVSRSAAYGLVLGAFAATDLTAVAAGGPDGRGRPTPRATRSAFAVWLGQQTP